jgi:hypothetical protein
LLTAVDVEGRPGNCRVDHEVDGQCDDASDRQSRAEVLPALVQFVAEDCR